jgi:hypothetical protein
MAFRVFGFTTSNHYYGCESETVAVTEGLVKTRRFQIMRDSPLAVYGHPFEGRSFQLCFDEGKLTSKNAY